MASAATKATEQRGEPEAGAPESGKVDWDSSSDEEILQGGKAEFYDPDVDEKDEKWAEKQRKGRQSDAILSCPACFTTLCLDCQRHERYPTQFRAMFVQHCHVAENEVLRMAAQSGSRKRSRRRKRGAGATDPPAEEELSAEAGHVFRPVCCGTCRTPVAVMDAQEVYHFYNAIPSYS